MTTKDINTRWGTYHANGDFTQGGKRHSKAAMERMAEAYAGCNRIHKPFALLVWTDCKNGKASNWVEVK